MGTPPCRPQHLASKILRQRRRSRAVLTITPSCNLPAVAALATFHLSELSVQLSFARPLPPSWMVQANPFSSGERPRGAGRRAGIGGGAARRPCKVYRHACPAGRSTRAGLLAAGARRPSPLGGWLARVDLAG